MLLRAQKAQMTFFFGIGCCGERNCITWCSVVNKATGDGAHEPTNLRNIVLSRFKNKMVRRYGCVVCLFSVLRTVRLLPFHHSFLTTSSSTVERRNYIIILYDILCIHGCRGAAEIKWRSTTGSVRCVARVRSVSLQGEVSFFSKVKVIFLMAGTPPLKKTKERRKW